MIKSCICKTNVDLLFSQESYKLHPRGNTLFTKHDSITQEVIDEFQKAMLSVKRAKGKCNSVACDLALEQYEIRYSAVTEGLI